MGRVVKPYAVVDAGYGRDRATVVRILKETAKTFSYLGRDWQGKWQERIQLSRRPETILARITTEAEAQIVANKANAAWRVAQQAVDDATAVLSLARQAQRIAFEAAISLATGEGE